VRSWILVNERMPWAIFLSCLLSPRRMGQMFKAWDNERDRAMVEESQKKIPPRGWATLFL
jgi:hypothetical protein